MVYNRSQHMPADLISSLQSPSNLMAIDAERPHQFFAIFMPHALCCAAGLWKVGGLGSGLRAAGAAHHHARASFLGSSPWNFMGFQWISPLLPQRRSFCHAVAACVLI